MIIDNSYWNEMLSLRYNEVFSKTKETMVQFAIPFPAFGHLSMHPGQPNVATHREALLLWTRFLYRLVSHPSLEWPMCHCILTHGIASEMCVLLGSWKACPQTLQSRPSTACTREHHELVTTAQNCSSAVAQQGSTDQQQTSPLAT